jgi:hypothetical protein
MSSDRVLDYLTEELIVEKNIVRVFRRITLMPLIRSFQVTYRSLSKALGIHVNEAKKCVPYFYNKTHDKPILPANLRSTTRITPVLSMLPARPISLVENRACHIWTACETQKRWL